MNIEKKEEINIKILLEILEKSVVGTIPVGCINCILPKGLKEKDVKRVDLIFLEVVVNKKEAEKIKNKFKKIISTYPSQERLKQGPSYIEIAGVLGMEQKTAFLFMALGKVLGFWDIITGKSLGMNQNQAMELAGRGLLNISGLKK